MLEKIVALPAFRDVAMRLHDLITLSAPHLEPRLWYGMPGYAPSKRSPVIVFFRVDDDRYVTLGLTEKANLVRGDGPDQLIESAWFLTDLDEATEERIARIVSTAAA
ncbi:DUF1801 domain-containing protein [Ilumatobacter sp.]|uniref:DUF1801 domain-containing protein n=1 Tax=Ilumatobacter sp. TaxID=1967498 RepID=UPI003AF84C6D